MKNENATFMTDQMKDTLLELGRMIEHIDRYDQDSLNLTRKLNCDKAIESMSALSNQIIEENQV